MDNLKQIRLKIDKIDEAILKSLSQRVGLCKEIGYVKNASGVPVKDSKREHEVYQHIRKEALSLGLDPDKVEAIYRQIVNMCSSIQEMGKE